MEAAATGGRGETAAAGTDAISDVPLMEAAPVRRHADAESDQLQQRQEQQPPPPPISGSGGSAPQQPQRRRGLRQIQQAAEALLGLPAGSLNPGRTAPSIVEMQGLQTLPQLLHASTRLRCVLL